jgi:hypothetical protein
MSVDTPMINPPVLANEELKSNPNADKVRLAAAKKEAKTADKINTKRLDQINKKKTKEAKTAAAAANKQRKSAEVARKKVLTELKKNQKKLRLAAEKEEKKQARIIAQREVLQARVIAQRELRQARIIAQREARIAAQREAANRRTLDLETQNRQIRMMRRCLSDTTTDIRSAPRTQQQLTCATTAFQTDECPICLEDLGETNCMVLRCGHKTCGDCILRHFQGVGGRKCPVCRDQYAVRVKGWIAPTPF